MKMKTKTKRIEKSRAWINAIFFIYKNDTNIRLFEKMTKIFTTGYELAFRSDAKIAIQENILMYA